MIPGFGRATLSCQSDTVPVQRTKDASDGIRKEL